jgi:DNA helicase-2/ATP-dependent DNA helicase PcrA
MVDALETEEDGADRIANVTELLAATAAFDPAEVEDAVEDATPLELYLQSTALHADIDDYDESEAGVTLMTLHNAKGLEFPAVFVVGLEEGLFPLARSSETAEELEEERRLFYVGVTRARDRLFLTHADRRWRYGSETRSAPSSFLDELPRTDAVERSEAGFLERRGAGSRSARKRPGRGRRPFALDDAGAPERFSWRRSSGGGSSAHPSEGNDGLRYDWSESQEELHVAPGARVVHPEFGEGEILSVRGEGRNTKAVIDFGEAGTRKVMVAHAGLRPA